MGRKRYPLVLMLEPLFRCNLACAGCGKIDYPDAILNKRLSVKDASTPSTSAARRSWRSPAASRCFIRKCARSWPASWPSANSSSLCTNALLLEKKLRSVQAASPYFIFSIHLDGLREHA